MQFVENVRAFTISEEQSTLAVQKLRALIEGRWMPDVRAKILELCNGSLGKSARPSYWSEKQTTQFAKAIGYPVEKFSGKSNYKI